MNTDYNGYIKNTDYVIPIKNISNVGHCKNIGFVDILRIQGMMNALILWLCIGLKYKNEVNSPLPRMSLFNKLYK